ncbi:MAG: HEAT repeat domain-containing protein [Acidobacteria bacterium]|nr:HEAT repeat domain-containing protein [Acidobacteriota bacterium]MYD71971.1 HEAT repeat domain-containing protein [Acidobacteriota bacterium]MYJ04967.1 HEAT repeat domain-containing protein [Acidobacteriota bacterium]
MQKLVEQENAPRVNPLRAAPALAVQFFLIPLAVVGMVVLVYGGFRMLVTTERTPQELLVDVQSGGRERRWPAAYELSRMLADPQTEAQNPELGAAIVQAFTDADGGDPRLRRYLALAIGRLAAPPINAVDELRGALNDPDNETRISVIWALASLGDVGVVADIEAMYASDDAGVRKMAVYALGTLPGSGDHGTLRNALDDPAADVQWNAAVALARHGRDDGITVLRRMLDREYVSRMVTRSAAAEAAIDPVSEVIVSGLQAAATLGAAELRPSVEALSESDANLRVREVAIKTLDVLNQSTRSRTG